MKSTCWNCRYFVYLGRGYCTEYFLEETDGDDSCNDFVIAEELKRVENLFLKKMDLENGSNKTKFSKEGSENIVGLRRCENGLQI